MKEENRDGKRKNGQRAGELASEFDYMEKLFINIGGRLFSSSFVFMCHMR